MAARFDPVRWMMIVLLGCTLGLIFVFWNLKVYGPRQHREAVERMHRSSRHPFMAPVTVSEEPVRAELIRVIQSQLTAFRKNDYPKAYRYAASEIQDQMPLPAFERMVRAGFPIFARSSSAEFGVILDNGEQAVVNVGIVGEGGRITRYQYFLEQERAGWRIDSVVRVPFKGIII